MKKKAGKEKEHGSEKTAEIRELTTWTIKKNHKLQVQRTARKSSPKAAPCETRERNRRETKTRTGLSKREHRKETGKMLLPTLLQSTPNL